MLSTNGIAIRNREECVWRFRCTLRLACLASVPSRALATFLLALIVLSGCASTAPQRGYPVSGRVGVVVSPPSTTRVPSVGGSFIEGFLTGLVGPAGYGLFFLGPVFAPIMAIQASECTNKLHAAYPGVSDKLVAILPREFLPTDLRDQIVKAYKEQASANIVAFDIPAGAGAAPSAERLIATLEQGGLDYLLSIEIKKIELESLTTKACENWGVRLALETRLWSVRERKIVSEFLVEPYEKRQFLQPIALAELKPLLDEPGALRAYLLRVFGVTARFMANRPVLAFPQ
jgi:hypothetical protein